MNTTGAEALIRSLEKKGVEIIFGYPGGSVLQIYDLLRDSSIKHVLTRSEQAAAHAASGYSRVTGRVGVCLATSGPGATNLITGIATAYMDSIPLVAITGQVSTDMIGKDVFQEVDITGATAPFTKHNYLVKDVKELPRIVKEAFYIASTGRPGPVLIDIPKDVAAAVFEYTYPERVDIRGYKPNYEGHPLQIQKAVKAINRARQPVICAGGGVVSSGCHNELLKLAEKCKIPVAMTLMGLGSIPGEHELALGMFGMHGTYFANKAVSQADLIIAAGARFGDRAIGKRDKFAPNAKIVHIDIDPAEIGKNIDTYIPIVGDLKRVLAKILEGTEEVKEREWLNTIKKLKTEHPLKYEKSEKLKPQFVIEKLYQLTRGRAIVSTEVGQHQIWTAHFYKFSEPRRFITSGGLGTMGYGFPAAIGAQLGRPEERVITISGDGSFQMNLPELATALENNLPIKIIVLNNGTLGMVRQLQDFYCNGRHSCVDFKFVPDFSRIAESYGALGVRIQREDEVEDALKTVLNSDKPAVADVIIDSDEKVFPMVLNNSPLSEMIGGY